MDMYLLLEEKMVKNIKIIKENSRVLFLKAAHIWYGVHSLFFLFFTSFSPVKIAVTTTSNFLVE